MAVLQFAETYTANCLVALLFTVVPVVLSTYDNSCTELAYPLGGNTTIHTDTMRFLSYIPFTKNELAEA